LRAIEIEISRIGRSTTKRLITASRTLTEYFVFPNAKLVLNDLYEMEPKVLSAVEVDVTGLRVF
jgi:hypothetical protein